MSLNFPASPTINQVYRQDGAVYQWSGVKWRRLNVFQSNSVTEYTDLVEQTANTVSIEPDKYNYFKINIDTDCTITLANANPFSNFVVELNLNGAAYTVEWDGNVQWAGGSSPSIDYGYITTVLIDFTTYDGINWIGSPLSLDSRSS